MEMYQHKWIEIKTTSQIFCAVGNMECKDANL